MKSYTFRLNEQEQEIVALLIRNPKYRQFKEPKEIYMIAAMEALKQISK